ncbi:MAG: aspartate carbamoyltransferase [Dehalococcoidia bacterium]|nr:aspartate carbamoyltransferase [Dehalococcoidia bacterium]
MYRGSLITIEDLSTSQIEDVLDLAQEMEQNRDSFRGVASHALMANLFFEPSTRTRGSFESAMKRLGGDVVGTSDATSTSMTKGESLADTVRIWSSYADLMVIRHPWEGAARLASEYSDVPVINAGDGSHEHPTQTLLDLYTLRKEFGTLQGKKIVLCGDLKNGRTVHSLVYALLRFGAVIIFVPGEGLGLPDHVLHKIEADYQLPIQPIRHRGLEALYSRNRSGEEEEVDVIYMTPSYPHTLTLFDSMDLHMEKGESFALYATRRQGERESSVESDRPGAYPRIDSSILRMSDFSKAFVLHPLPRVDELSPSIDADPRSRYFQQARNGVPVRMSLIALMLGLYPWSKASRGDEGGPPRGASWDEPEVIVCDNPNCAATIESQNASHSFTIYQRPLIRLVCSYCERETIPSYFSYPFGEVYHPITDFPKERVDTGRFGFYRDTGTAQARGLRHPRRVTQEGQDAGE